MARHLQLLFYSRSVLYCRGVWMKYSQGTRKNTVYIKAPYWRDLLIVSMDSVYNIYGDLHCAIFMRLGMRICRSGKILRRIWHGCFGETSMISQTASVERQLLGIFFVSMVRRQCAFVVMKTWCWGSGYSTIYRATPTTSEVVTRRSFWSAACAGLCDTVLDIRVSCGVLLCATTATGCECQEITLRSDGKTPRTEWLMNAVPSGFSTAIMWSYTETDMCV